MNNFTKQTEGKKKEEKNEEEESEENEEAIEETPADSVVKSLVELYKNSLSIRKQITEKNFLEKTDNKRSKGPDPLIVGFENMVLEKIKYIRRKLLASTNVDELQNFGVLFLFYMIGLGFYDDNHASGSGSENTEPSITIDNPNLVMGVTEEEINKALQNESQKDQKQLFIRLCIEDVILFNKFYNKLKNYDKRIWMFTEFERVFFYCSSAYTLNDVYAPSYLTVKHILLELEEKIQMLNQMQLLMLDHGLDNDREIKNLAERIITEGKSLIEMFTENVVNLYKSFLDKTQISVELANLVLKIVESYNVTLLHILEYNDKSKPFKIDSKLNKTVLFNIKQFEKKAREIQTLVDNPTSKDGTDIFKDSDLYQATKNTQPSLSSIFNLEKRIDAIFQETDNFNQKDLEELMREISGRYTDLDECAKNILNNDTSNININITKKTVEWIISHLLITRSEWGNDSFYNYFHVQMLELLECNEYLEHDPFNITMKDVKSKWWYQILSDPTETIEINSNTSQEIFNPNNNKWILLFLKLILFIKSIYSIFYNVLLGNWMLYQINHSNSSSSSSSLSSNLNFYCLEKVIDEKEQKYISKTEPPSKNTNIPYVKCNDYIHQINNFLERYGTFDLDVLFPYIFHIDTNTLENQLKRREKRKFVWKFIFPVHVFFQKEKHKLPPNIGDDRDRKRRWPLSMSDSRYSEYILQQTKKSKLKNEGPNYKDFIEHLTPTNEFEDSKPLARTIYIIKATNNKLLASPNSFLEFLYIGINGSIGQTTGIYLNQLDFLKKYQKISLNTNNVYRRNLHDFEINFKKYHGLNYFQLNCRIFILQNFKSLQYLGYADDRRFNLTYPSKSLYPKHVILINLPNLQVLHIVDSVVQNILEPNLEEEDDAFDNDQTSPTEGGKRLTVNFTVYSRIIMHCEIVDEIQFLMCHNCEKMNIFQFNLQYVKESVFYKVARKSDPPSLGNSFTPFHYVLPALEELQQKIMFNIDLNDLKIKRVANQQQKRVEKNISKSLTKKIYKFLNSWQPFLMNQTRSIEINCNLNEDYSDPDKLKLHFRNEVFRNNDLAYYFQKTDLRFNDNESYEKWTEIILLPLYRVINHLSQIHCQSSNFGNFYRSIILTLKIQETLNDEAGLWYNNLNKLIVGSHALKKYFKHKNSITSNQKKDDDDDEEYMVAFKEQSEKILNNNKKILLNNGIMNIFNYYMFLVSSDTSGNEILESNDHLYPFHFSTYLKNDGYIGIPSIVNLKSPHLMNKKYPIEMINNYHSKESFNNGFKKIFKHYTSKTDLGFIHEKHSFFDIKQEYNAIMNLSCPNLNFIHDSWVLESELFSTLDDLNQDYHDCFQIMLENASYLFPDPRAFFSKFLHSKPNGKLFYKYCEFLNHNMTKEPKMQFHTEFPYNKKTIDFFKPLDLGFYLTIAQFYEKIKIMDARIFTVLCYHIRTMVLQPLLVTTSSSLNPVNNSMEVEKDDFFLNGKAKKIFLKNIGAIVIDFFLNLFFFSKDEPAESIFSLKHYLSTYKNKNKNKNENEKYTHYVYKNAQGIINFGEFSKNNQETLDLLFQIFSEKDSNLPSKLNFDFMKRFYTQLKIDNQYRSTVVTLFFESKGVEKKTILLSPIPVALTASIESKTWKKVLENVNKNKNKNERKIDSKAVAPYFKMKTTLDSLLIKFIFNENTKEVPKRNFKDEKDTIFEKMVGLFPRIRNLFIQYAAKKPFESNIITSLSNDVLEIFHFSKTKDDYGFKNRPITEKLIKYFSNIVGKKTNMTQEQNQNQRGKTKINNDNNKNNKKRKFVNDNDNDDDDDDDDNDNDKNGDKPTKEARKIYSRYDELFKKYLEKVHQNIPPPYSEINQTADQNNSKRPLYWKMSSSSNVERDETVNCRFPLSDVLELVHIKKMNNNVVIPSKYLTTFKWLNGVMISNIKSNFNLSHEMIFQNTFSHFYLENIYSNYCFEKTYTFTKNQIEEEVKEEQTVEMEIEEVEKEQEKQNVDIEEEKKKNQEQNVEIEEEKKRQENETLIEGVEAQIVEEMETDENKKDKDKNDDNNQISKHDDKNNDQNIKKPTKAPSSIISCHIEPKGMKELLNPSRWYHVEKVTIVENKDKKYEILLIKNKNPNKDPFLIKWTAGKGFGLYLKKGHNWKKEGNAIRAFYAGKFTKYVNKHDDLLNLNNKKKNAFDTNSNEYDYIYELEDGYVDGHYRLSLEDQDPRYALGYANFANEPSKDEEANGEFVMDKRGKIMILPIKSIEKKNYDVEILVCYSNDKNLTPQKQKELNEQGNERGYETSCLTVREDDDNNEKNNVQETNLRRTEASTPAERNGNSYDNYSNFYNRYSEGNENETSSSLSQPNDDEEYDDKVVNSTFYNFWPEFSARSNSNDNNVNNNNTNNNQRSNLNNLNNIPPDPFGSVQHDDPFMMTEDRNRNSFF